MQITRLEIAGFKSFGSRKIFNFQPGITAIVGPNGSGKSNVADAIRWVLGEQKTKRLRVAKSEDVVFHGTDKKPQASMAEVSILFDNTKGRFPLEISEIEISRRLLRSGESEYRLNGRKTKLTQIEELLAKTGFGTESYTVVGQGMIDQLLTATGTERKMLFDEASGIRQFDIRRNEARRNLKSASNNLNRVRDILSELKPISEALRLQTANVTRLTDLKAELKDLQVKYLQANMYELDMAKQKLVSQSLADEGKLRDVTAQLNDFHTKNSALRKLQRLQPSQAEELKGLELERDNLTQHLLLLQSEKNVLEAKKQSILPSKKQIKEQELKLTQVLSQLEKLTHEHEGHSIKTQKIELEIAAINSQLGVLTTQLEGMRAQLSKSQKKEFVNHALGLVQLVRTQLRQTNSRRDIDASMHKLSQMLELALQDNAAELAIDIVKVQNQISKCMSTREDIVEVQTQEVIGLRSIELDIASLQAQQKKLETENSNNTDNKKLTQTNQAITQHTTKIISLHKQLKTIDARITAQRDKLYSDNEGSINQDAAYSSVTQQIETLAGEKARLELMLDRHQQESAVTDEKIAELGRLSKTWLGKAAPPLAKKMSTISSLHQIEELDYEVRAIENIDPNLVAEAQETAQRVEFLQTQENDLKIAIADTQQLIVSLEKDIRVRFEKSFTKINTSFNTYFIKLFSGGSAELKLITQDDGEYGIEISVSPAGKRGKSINALSGGEKALASIALLAAILTSNPSPFIVLDEVDAALDDENSTRFSKVLTDLAIKSQVLVITHNHETMQSAQNIFGVTTGEKGDSEVLQLAIQQASQLIET